MPKSRQSLLKIDHGETDTNKMQLTFGHDLLHIDHSQRDHKLNRSKDFPMNDIRNTDFRALLLEFARTDRPDSYEIRKDDETNV